MKSGLIQTGVALIVAVAVVGAFVVGRMTAPVEYVNLSTLSNEVMTLQVNGKEIQIPADAVEVEIEFEDDIETDDTEVTDKTKTSTGTGIGVRSSENAAWTQMNFETPKAAINGSSAESGAFSFGWEGFASNPGLMVLSVIGGLAILTGLAIMVFLRMWIKGAMLIVAGIAAIAIGAFMQEHMWVIWVLLALAIGVGVWLFVSSGRAKKLKEAFVGVVEGIHLADLKGGETATQPVKAEIGARNEAMNGLIKDEVNKVKKGLPNAVVPST